MEQIIDYNTDTPIDIVKYRRGLLPWWIKGFSWLFIIFGIFTIPAIIASIANLPFDLAFYGMESTTVLSVKGAIITLFFAVSAVVGYGLFFGKPWAVLLGLVLCAMHVFLLASVIALPLVTEDEKIRLEFILVIPFFIKLLKLKKVWHGPQNNSTF